MEFRYPSHGMDRTAGRRRAKRPSWKWAIGGLSLFACGGEGMSEGGQALAELERLAFVPPAECVFPPLSGPPLACVTAEALLVDRFEVTRAEWRAWCERASDASSPALAENLAGWREETGHWPATFMTLSEARRFAAARGMRLLTSAEWIRVACGPGRQPWPWGPSAASAVANTLDLELYRPVPVGTFEQGRSPELVYDLIGNVWEWVEAPMPWPALETLSGLEWAMGGSHLSKLGRLYDRVTDAEGAQRWNFIHQDLDPRTRASDIGLRCAAEAKPYLRGHASDWGTSESVRRRLVAVGSSWGRDAVPVLEALADEAGAAPGLAWLLEGARQ